MAEIAIDQAMEIAVQHRLAGQFEQAEQLCRQILAAQPNHCDAINLFAVLAYQAGRTDIAIDWVNRAIALNPTAEYHSNLGNFLQADGWMPEAVSAYLKALAIKPDLAEVHNNLGSVYTSLGQLDQAISSHSTAIGLNPQLTEAYSNLGNAFTDFGKIDQAIAAYRQAISLKPDYAQVHWNLAIALLLKGDYAEGWCEYEWRWKCEDQSARRFTQPLWDGGDLTGRTILLHAEQGFGDTLHFIRYAALVKDRGGRVIVECQQELIGLLKQLTSVTQWITRGQPLPPFDVHRPLLSLPFVFGTTLENIPQQTPPLQAPANRVEQWRHRVADKSVVLKVGLAWAGNPHHKNDRNRSILLSQLMPLLEIPHIQFFSLQKGASTDGTNLLNLTTELHDFNESAALISNLDLIISVDTSVVHLAAAMGKPTWVMLPFAPDWRWLQQRDDSPWYPSIRLFRQTRIGDWPGVIDQVAAELARRCGSSAEDKTKT